MLVYVALFLLLVYVILDRTGVLTDLANTFRPRDGAPADKAPEPETRPELDSDARRRLEVFEEFIEGLDPGENDDK